MFKRLWNWLTKAKKDSTQEWLKQFEPVEPDPPQDLSDLSDVPPSHLGVIDVPHPTETRTPFRFTEQVRGGLNVHDLETMPDHTRQLFEELTPSDPAKTVRMPAPTEQTTADWVTERLKYYGYDHGVAMRAQQFRRVAVGVSMRHLGDLKRRAEARDKSLSAHDLMLLRSRGLA